MVVRFSQTEVTEVQVVAVEQTQYPTLEALLPLGKDSTVALVLLERRLQPVAVAELVRSERTQAMVLEQEKVQGMAVMD